MRKILFPVILTVLLVPTVTAEVNGPAGHFTIKQMVDLGLFDSPQQGVLRTRNTERFKDKFLNEYVITESDLAPPDVNRFTFPSNVQVEPLPVDQKIGEFTYADLERQVINSLDFLSWSETGAHLDTNKNGIPEPTEPRLNIDGQTVTIDQVTGFLPTLPLGRYNYSFWRGLQIGNAPFPLDISIDWDGNTESVRKIINNSFNIPYIPTGLIGDYRVSSKVQITNTDCVDWPVTLDFLDVQTGQPADAKIGEMIKPSHEFVIPAGMTKQIDVKSPDDLLKYLGASLSVPYSLGNPELDLSVTYTTRDTQGNLMGSAGISVGRPDTFHSIFVEKETKLETGIPIDNDTGLGVFIPEIAKPVQEVPIKMLFVSEDSSFTGLAIINGMKGGQATVRYVGEYFSDSGGSNPQASQTLPENFRGTLMVTAPCDIVVFAIQTENGFQQSSLTSNGSPMQRF